MTVQTIGVLALLVLSHGIQLVQRCVDAAIGVLTD